jgi:hypothetical protein
VWNAERRTQQGFGRGDALAIEQLRAARLHIR